MDFILNKREPLYVLSSVEAQEILEKSCVHAKASLTVCTGENYAALVGQDISVFMLPAVGSINCTWSEDVCTDKILVLTFLNEKIVKRSEFDITKQRLSAEQLVHAIASEMINPFINTMVNKTNRLLPVKTLSLNTEPFSVAF